MNDGQPLFHKVIATLKKELIMKKADTGNLIKVVTLNPPTKKQAEERVKKLSDYLGKIWNIR